MHRPTSTSDSGSAALIKGNLFILIATIFFGVNIPVVKFLIPQWMTAMDVSVFRLGGACILFWIASAFMKPQRIDHEDWKSLLLGGAIGLFSFIYLFNLSLSYGNPIDISIIMTLPPVFVILIDAVFRHRKISRLEIIGIIIAFAGAVIVIMSAGNRDSHSSSLAGDLLALASALCYALYLIFTERPSKKYHPVSMLRWIFLFAAIPASILLPDLFHAKIVHDYSLQPWLMIGFVIVCPTFLAYFLVSPAIKIIGSELVSIYQYLVPVIATIASVAMGLCNIHWQQIAAVVIIISGMSITTVASRRQSSAIHK